MKYYLLLFIIFLFVQKSSAQSQFSDGFESGYKSGYCQDKGISCIAPIPPIAPLPTTNESLASYKDGYNRGFQLGLKAQSGSTEKKGYQTAKANYIDNKMSNPLANIDMNNLMAVADALKKMKQQALDYFEEENYQAAAEIGFAGYKINNTDPEFMMIIGQAYRYSGDRKNAIKWYKRAARRTNNGNLRNLIRNLENGAELGPEEDKKETSSSQTESNRHMGSTSTPNTVELSRNAVSEFKAGNYHEAYRLSSAAIAANPNNSAAYYIRANSHYYGFKNYQEAIKDFSVVLQLTDTFNDVHYLKGLCHYNIGEYQEAIRSFSEHLQSDDTNTDVYFARAMAKSEVGDFLGAIRDYDKIIELNPTYPMQNNNMTTIYNNKAYCLVQQKKYSEALPLVNKALQTEKNIWYIWDTRGEIFYHMGQYKKSIEDMDKSLSLEKHYNSFYIRGLAKIKLGQKEEGCTDLSMAGELGKTEAYEKIKELCN